MEALTAAWYRRGAAQHADAASTTRLATETEKARDRFVKHEHISATMQERMGATQLPREGVLRPLQFVKSTAVYHFEFVRSRSIISSAQCCM